MCLFTDANRSFWTPRTTELAPAVGPEPHRLVEDDDDASRRVRSLKGRRHSDRRANQRSPPVTIEAMWPDSSFSRSLVLAVF